MVRGAMDSAEVQIYLIHEESLMLHKYEELGFVFLNNYDHIGFDVKKKIHGFCHSVWLHNSCKKKKKPPFVGCKTISVCFWTSV